MLTVDPLDIAIINTVAAYAGIRVLPHYLHWVFRDRERLFQVHAGFLVFALTLLVVMFTYEAGYYAVARILHSFDVVNMWQEGPWTAWVAVVRSVAIAALFVAYIAKLRADGMEVLVVRSRTIKLALECVFIAAVMSFFL